MWFLVVCEMLVVGYGGFLRWELRRMELLKVEKFIIVDKGNGLCVLVLLCFGELFFCLDFLVYMVCKGSCGVVCDCCFFGYVRSVFVYLSLSYLVWGLGCWGCWVGGWFWDFGWLGLYRSVVVLLRSLVLEFFGCVVFGVELGLLRIFIGLWWDLGGVGGVDLRVSVGLWVVLLGNKKFVFCVIGFIGVVVEVMIGVGWM